MGFGFDCPNTSLFSKGHRYILVGVDYFTNWVEAAALRDVTQREEIDFVENHIVCHFGISETHTVDQGSVFTGRKVVDYTSSRGIKLLT